MHRFPLIHGHAREGPLPHTLVDEWGRGADALWMQGDPDGTEVLKRLRALPGFGEPTAKIFLALLGK